MKFCQLMQRNEVLSYIKSNILYRMVRLSNLIILILLSASLFGQEICINGIDDDNDGLIDLNDPDCQCNNILDTSLIPNPSFESRSCCPSGENQLNCADNWVQASAPTTDYWHTCGATCHFFTGNCAPLPPPDGDGFIGFRDGKPGSPNFKEYSGACLTSTMEIGVEYTIDFFTGFADRNDNQTTSFEIALFATTSCGNLPFGQNNTSFGCPTNGQGWVQLDQISLSGNNEWINTTFSFVAEEAYAAIVLGPACETNPQFTIDPYFFFDRLLVVETEQLEIPLTNIESDCDEGTVLTITDDPDFSYQWYKDGIAVEGATDNELFIPNESEAEGIYTVYVGTIDGCFTTEAYSFEEEVLEETFAESICAGESYQIGLQFFDTPGFHQVSLISSEGCDSTVSLFLTVNEPDEVLIEETLCAGETFEFMDSIFTETGIFEFMSLNQFGCERTNILDLVFNDGLANLDLGPDLEVQLGDSISLSPISSHPDNTDYVWTNDEGVEIGTSEDLLPFFPIRDQFIFLETIDGNGCPAIDSVFIRMNNNVELYVPNIFSPNRDGTNDDFLARGNPAIVGLEEVLIFDRWGNKVFEDGDKSIGRGQTLFEWDGRFRNRDATEGVYAFVLTARVIDGSTIFRSGDVTLVR